MKTRRRPILSLEDMFSLRGRVAIVTGASSGLGERFTRVLAASGATVLATARRRERLDELSKMSPNIIALPADVSVEADRRRIANQAATVTGVVDVLVNCAGASGDLVAKEESAEDVAAVLATNVVAVQRLSCLAMELAADGFSIVNVASILGMVAGAPMGGASYSASKGAVIALTRELAAQWGHLGIRVNALVPGWFESEMTRAAFEDDRTTDWLARRTLLGRTGQSHELDAALLFLASSASSYVTGQTLVVDGGWTAR